ncbi:GntR family transcriptional regulator [Arthrobacter sp. zg-ZUI100]|uniref:GntR family transcriptional regulator n=1 Tax=Arthrobacter jiangjiafuii TaxID=2817475 RepID=A0A975M6Y6_9MICC|nr:GntR family transcriptional regulator [Arthrobacter jiangjiafuii]MBP3037773.1 GntR family transcriptional regulator [Arthrobacter jiangjiafuii]MBP3045114.1 GntR family transcriptional regulator [Arthrobacter jiangjiafuii]QWC10571.1 GntR family transcriptional regulator [Arthrobacter jiangjiafuii]
MTAEPTATKTSAVQVAGAIRAAIMNGELVPAQRLVEADLCTQFGASRSAVRSALAELAVEGVVERVQNRGARVRSVSVEEAVEIIEVRGALEALCARKAAERITPEQVTELRKLAAEMSQAVATGELARYSATNSELHRRIVEISGQGTAGATIERLRAQNVRHQFRLAAQPGRASVSLPEHVEIVEAICAGNAAEAARMMEAHMTSIADAIRRSAAASAS